jgi:hypothetical protein
MKYKPLDLIIRLQVISQRLYHLKKANCLKQSGQLGVAVGNVSVLAAVLAESGDDVAEGQQAHVDGHALLHAVAHRLRLAHPLRARQIDQVELGENTERQFEMDNFDLRANSFLVHNHFSGLFLLSELAQIFVNQFM